MVSQAAARLLSVAPLPDRSDYVRAQLELACGCVVVREIANDRILERPDGTRFAVGKYPCPVGHPVTR